MEVLYIYMLMCTQTSVEKKGWCLPMSTDISLDCGAVQHIYVVLNSMPSVCVLEITICGAVYSFVGCMQCAQMPSNVFARTIDIISLQIIYRMGCGSISSLNIASMLEQTTSCEWQRLSAATWLFMMSFSAVRSQYSDEYKYAADCAAVSYVGIGDRGGGEIIYSLWSEHEYVFRAIFLILIALLETGESQSILLSLGKMNLLQKFVVNLDCEP